MQSPISHETVRRALTDAEDSYRRYIDALNAKDGTELCALIDPSFQSELELPVPRGSCAERLSASLGYADPSGAPVWKATELSPSAWKRVCRLRVKRMFASFASP